MEIGVLLLLGPAIVIADLGLKRVLRQRLACEGLSLGPLGCVRTVTARLWLVRLERRVRVPAACALWGLLAASFVALSVWLPASRVPICLMLAGSVSNLLEFAARGAVTDYVCLRGWPAFNLADVALTLGALGLLATSLAPAVAAVA